MMGNQVTDLMAKSVRHAQIVELIRFSRQQQRGYRSLSEQPISGP